MAEKLVIKGPVFIEDEGRPVAVLVPIELSRLAATVADTGPTFSSASTSRVSQWLRAREGCLRTDETETYEAVLGQVRCCGGRRGS